MWYVLPKSVPVNQERTKHIEKYAETEAFVAVQQQKNLCIGEAVQRGKNLNIDV